MIGEEYGGFAKKSIHAAGHGRYKTVYYKIIYGTIDGS